MDHISGFFSRYLSPYLEREKTKEYIAKICSEVLGVSILPEHIIVSGNKCIISGSQSLKHQIFLKQEEILQILHTQKNTARLESIQ